MPSSFGGSGYDKRSQPSRVDGNDKDWIPLVETVTVPTKDSVPPTLPPTAATASSNDEKTWPLGGGKRKSGAWNEPASWESARAPRRATLERRNSVNAGGRWKISMDS